MAKAEALASLRPTNGAMRQIEGRGGYGFGAALFPSKATEACARVFVVGLYNPLRAPWAYLALRALQGRGIHGTLQRLARPELQSRS
jgi:hypothetical protein